MLKFGKFGVKGNKKIKLVKTENFGKFKRKQVKIMK